MSEKSPSLTESEWEAINKLYSYYKSLDLDVINSSEETDFPKDELNIKNAIRKLLINYEVRNQTLAEVLKIVDKIVRGEKTSIDRLRVELKEEIKKIHSQGQPLITQGARNRMSSENDGKLNSPDTNTQNLKGCGKCDKSPMCPCIYCGRECEKCQGKVQ